ncbi:hypothetical protein [Staphylococcus epidermidis]|uniref:hypothetical protein n=1 Tax=Staphylococcus epidermidis TaxID=1282 RepID=UPI0011A0E1BD|nr:hypothetical protein [Staphylococcus epidermidis]
MLVGVVIGGMMGIEMGGGFNKGGYVFASAGLREGNGGGISGGMIGGMIGGLGMGRGMLMFRRKLSKEERG